MLAGRLADWIADRLGWLAGLPAWTSKKMGWKCFSVANGWIKKVLQFWGWLGG